MKKLNFEYFPIQQILLTICVALSAVQSIHAKTPITTKEGLELSEKASLNARNLCQVLMHEDSFEFEKCSDRLLEKLPKKNRSEQFIWLGTSYYAWLSSTSAAKNGLPGAEKAAKRYVLLFRPLQKKLRLSDQDLCKTIEGDCESRVARLLIMEKEAILSSKTAKSNY